jgi:hypothetical protein
VRRATGIAPTTAADASSDRLPAAADNWGHWWCACRALYDPDRTVFEDLDITNIDAVNA